jgi:glycosyltransferase involved in cell wall biosynthesis
MSAARRVLITSHSHPALSNGGAEIAAWRLLTALEALPGWEPWFMGCAREPGGRAGSAITQPFGALPSGERQFLYNSASFDWFKFANGDAGYPRALTAVLRDVAPDILHFHHYAVFGVETFLHIRRALPDSRIVLTLHEYQAICNHYGQMVTREKNMLCYGASPRDCNKCYPEFSRTDFFLRRAYIMRFLDLVDHFISPSQFLAERYIAWGVPAAKMSVIENVTRAATADEAAATANPRVLRVGFFGQISYLKGINVLLDAAAILQDEAATPGAAAEIQFEIHGDASNQPAEFQADFQQRIGQAGHNVHFHGAYDNQRVDQLMCAVDAVLVPSIWWENSPVVIQECLRNRRPIVCSNIGGMAEKVRHGVDGWHFPMGNAVALAALLKELAGKRDHLAAMAAGIRQPEAPEETAMRHVALYERLLAG